jgi:hypothetical protein
VNDKLFELKLSYAQAQSDKIELMRDIATYEFNFCEGLSFKDQMTQMRDYIADYRDQIKSLGVESDMFQDRLLAIVEDGVNKQQDRLCSMRYSKDLIQKRRGLKKLKLVTGNVDEN